MKKTLWKWLARILLSPLYLLVGIVYILMLAFMGYFLNFLIGLMRYGSISTAKAYADNILEHPVCVEAPFR